MLSNIKEELLKSPETIQSILEYFGYANVHIHDSYMSFGRDQFSSPKAIVIWLKNNEYLYVKDYARNIYKDFFSFIMEQRGLTFKQVISVVNDYLGITDYNTFFEKRCAFGGFYNRAKKGSVSDPPKVYNPEILDQYEKIGNLMFLKDNISLEAQNFFDIRFDVENDGIIIPLYDTFGGLIALKERVNHPIEENEQKYWYLLPGRASKSLYGFWQNYKYLNESTVFVFESEKSVMQCYSYGIRNCIALSSGSISRDQIKILHEIQPEKVIFMHDIGYDKSLILKNINAYKRYNRFIDTELGYWDWTKSGLTEKYSPSDLGRSELERIIDNEIVYV